MKNEKSKGKRLKLAMPPDRKSYAVGYAKPPEKSRFKPGRSGNPKGRPKGSKSSSQVTEHERMKSIVLEEAYRKVTVNEGEKQVSMPMAKAIVRSLAVSAAKGNARSQKIFTELLKATELSNKLADEDRLTTIMNYKLGWEEELERRKRLKITATDPIPHPDDVVIDTKTGATTFEGPMSKEELAELDHWLKLRHSHEVELRFFEESLRDPAYIDFITSLEGDISQAKHVLRLINKAVTVRASLASARRRVSQLDLRPPEYLETLGDREKIEIADYLLTNN